MRKVSNRLPIFKVSLFVLGLILLYFVFRDGRLDEWVTALFYDPSGGFDAWPQKHMFWVQIFDKSSSLLTVLMGLSVIVGYVASFFWKDIMKYRSLFLLMFLSIAIGPGLLVNAVFKDHWGRARPKETISFGGDKEFQAPFVKSNLGGKSFPCGHCSVVFALTGFAYWFGRERKKLFHLLFWSSVITGTIMGMARIVVGAHYLSDVFASGMIVVGVVWMLVFFFPSLKCPVRREEGDLKSSPALKCVMLVVASIAAGAMGFFALLSFPFHHSEQVELELPQQLFDRAGSLSLKVEVDESTKLAFKPMILELHSGNMVFVESKGFGFPWCAVDYFLTLSASGESLFLVVRKKGLFSELKTNVRPLINESK